MSVQVTKSEFWTRNAPAVAAVVDVARHERPKTGFIEPPGGIKGGIARVVFCGFGKNDDGEYYRFEAGIEVPKVHDGLPTTGIKVSKIAMLRDTDREASVRGVVEIVQLLGVDVPPGAQFDPALVGAAISNANPPVYVRFSTRSVKGGKPKPGGGVYEDKVFVDFHGAVPYTPPNVVPSTNGNGYHAPTPKTADPAPWSTNPSVAVAATVTTKPPEPKPVEKKETPQSFPLTDTYRDDEDLDSLGSRASSDPTAADRLRELAMAAGYSRDQVEDSDSWTTVVEWIRGGGPKVEAEAEPVIPVKGNLCWYSAPDPKGGKRSRKCFEIKEVKPRKGTVNLVQNDDRSRKYEDVPFADIEHEE